MKTFLKYLAPYRVSLALVLIFAIVSTVFMILGPKLLGNATTKLFDGIVAKVTMSPVQQSISHISVGSLIFCWAFMCKCNF